MMNTEAKEKLDKAAHAINMAVILLKMEMPTFEAFLEECRKMDSFGPVISPTLFRDPERRAVSAIMKPLFEEAIIFVRKFDAQMEQVKAALARVNG